MRAILIYLAVQTQGLAMGALACFVTLALGGQQPLLAVVTTVSYIVGVALGAVVFGAFS